MKFLYIAPRYHTNQLSIMKGLVEHGHEVCYVSHYQALLEDYSYVKPVTLGYSFLYQIIDFIYVHIIHRWNPEAIVFKVQHGFPPVRKLKRIIKDFRPDVVILREKSIYSIVSYLICREKGYPCILYNQSPLWSEGEKTDFAHLIVDKLSPKMRMTPVLGIQKAGTSIKENDYFIPFVVEPQKAPTQRTYFKGDVFNILCVGKYEKRKNHFMLLQVVEKLHHKYPIHLTLIGEATNRFQKEYYEEVNNYVKEYNLNEIVTLKINIPRQKMNIEYTNADIFVIPSTREMASISQLEAMSFSIPVICSNTNGTACYIEDGITGYLFKDNDRKDLEQKLNNILLDKEAILKMGAAGYQSVVKKYNFQQYYEGIIKILEKIHDKQQRRLH